MADVESNFVSLQEWFPLAPAQSWFFEQNPIEPQRYNQSIAIRFHQPIELEFAQAVLSVLAARHDAFRLRFREVDGTWTQCVVPDTSIPVEVDDLTDEADSAAELGQITARLNRSLNLRDGPVVRATLVSQGGVADFLIIVMHHLTVDAISWRILLEEIDEISNALKRGISATLSRESAPFINWVKSLEAQTPFWTDEISFWQSQDYSTPFVDQGERSTGRKRIVLSAEITRLLLASAGQEGWPLDCLILAALTDGLTGASDPGISVDIETHGRSDFASASDLSRSVGWFTAIWPIHIQRTNGPLLQRTSAIAAQYDKVPRQGVGFGALRYLARMPDVANIPRSEVLFTYLGRTELASGGHRLFDVERIQDLEHSTEFGASPYALTINSWVEDNRLTLDCYWKLDPENTRMLSNIIDQAVECLTAHAEATNKDRAGGAPARCAPSTETERTVYRAWKEVLGSTISSNEEDFGIDDQFSDLGGDSIHMIQIVSRLRREFEVRVPLKIIGEFKTVRNLSEKIDAVVDGADTF